jgi:hypothetical protein
MGGIRNFYAIAVAGGLVQKKLQHKWVFKRVLNVILFSLKMVIKMLSNN